MKLDTNGKSIINLSLTLLQVFSLLIQRLDLFESKASVQ